jgi:hypothetical protein
VAEGRNSCHQGAKIVREKIKEKGARLVRIMGGRNLSLKKIITQREEGKGVDQGEVASKTAKEGSYPPAKAKRKDGEVRSQSPREKNQTSSKIPAERVEGISQVLEGGMGSGWKLRIPQHPSVSMDNQGT